MSMEKELLNTFDKELLLKDLCARLPYGVKVNGVFLTYDKDKEKILYKECVKELNYSHLSRYWTLKPYLFPLSSMTEEQKESSPFEPSLLNAFINGHIFLFEDEELNIDDLNRLYDWFNKNHFDYRNLIDKNLAIDCTNLNIY